MLAYIEKMAKGRAQIEFRGHLDTPKEIFQRLNEDLWEIDEDSHKLAYLTIILEANEAAYQAHKKHCSNPGFCGKDDTHEAVQYFLNKELGKLGVPISEDAFNREEKDRLTNYLDKILSDLKTLKDGQEVIHDGLQSDIEELKAEIAELKRWFILGKKNWRQLALGKLGDIAASTVIGDSIIKPLIEELSKVEITALIG